MEGLVFTIIALFACYLVGMALVRLGIESFERSVTPMERMWGLFRIVIFAVLFLSSGIIISFLIFSN
jgi:hypothetical protein